MSTVHLRRRTLAGALASVVAAAGGVLALPASPAAAATPQVAITTTATNPTTGVTLRVQGTGFSAMTLPGDMGVYVGLAPSGGLGDVSSQSAMDRFAAAAWVSPAQMPEGSFTVSLTAAPEKLDPATSYSVYTWQAHTHSNTSQDTETPVAIDWAAMKQAPTVAASWKKKPKTPKKKGQLEVSVGASGRAATGAVRVVLELKDGSKSKTVAGSLANGAVLLTLPKLAAGKWTVAVSYDGDRWFTAGQTSLSVKVKPKPKRG